MKSLARYVRSLSASRGISPPSGLLFSSDIPERRESRSLIGVLALGLSLLVVAPASAEQVAVLHLANGVSPGKVFSQPAGIFFDTEKRECYVADTGNHQVAIFDENGMPIFHFPHLALNNGKWIRGEPKSIVVDKDGRIFLTDILAPYIDVLDYTGRTIERIDPPQDVCGGTGRFSALALAPGGQVAATLTCQEPWIVFIDSDLNISRKLLLQSRETTNSISGIALDESGAIYVTDPHAEIMVQVYNADGSFVMGFGRHDAGFENFSFPAGIAVLDNGDMWVVDSIRQIAARFSPEGDLKTWIGGMGGGLGSFNFPSAITTDGNDLVFVVERGGNRYQCFQVVLSK
jgi:sugar lactone lactonase YvrE